MKFENAYIPLNAAWSSPFVRWQGPAAERLEPRRRRPGHRAGAATSAGSTAIDELVLGLTVPQKQSFYGAPTLAARLGLGAVSGPLIMQACATSVACVHAAAAGGDGRGWSCSPTARATARTSSTRRRRARRHAAERELGAWTPSAATRTRARACSPRPSASPRRAGSQGRGRRGHRAPLGAVRGGAATASRSAGWCRSRRLKRKRPRSTPTGASARRRWRRSRACRPVTEGGVVSYGSQTHPADGCAGLIVTSRAGRGPDPRVRLRPRRARRDAEGARARRRAAALDDAGLTSPTSTSSRPTTRSRSTTSGSRARRAPTSTR